MCAWIGSGASLGLFGVVIVLFGVHGKNSRLWLDNTYVGDFLCFASGQNLLVGEPRERRAPHYGAEIMRAGRPLIGLEFKIQPSDWFRGQVPHSGNKGK